MSSPSQQEQTHPGPARSPIPVRIVHKIAGLFCGADCRRGFLAAATLLAALIATFFTTSGVKARVDEETRMEFDHDCQLIKTKIMERLHEHQQILRSGAAFFSQNQVTRQEWHEFTERQKVNQMLPGIQGLGFSLLVPRQQLAGHIRQIRAEGFPDYRVWPEGDRDTYSSVIFLEPFSGRNLRAFGYDMLTEPIRRAAMQQSRDLDETILTGKITLVQETNQDIQAGTLMYAPVYAMGMPHGTLAERRAATTGWVYSPYRMNDLMNGTLDGMEVVKGRHPHVIIYDGATPSPAALLYDNQTDNEKNTARTARTSRQMSIPMAGRTWLLDISQADESAIGPHQVSIWLVSCGGTMGSLLLSALVLSLLSTRSRAREMALRLTDDLRKSEERWEYALEGAGDGVWDWNVVTGELILSKRWKEMLGYQENEIGTSLDEWRTRVHPEDFPQVLADVSANLDGKTASYVNTHRFRCKDGSWKWVLDRGMVMSRDAEGRPLRMIGTHADMTESKRFEEEIRNVSERLSLAVRAGGVGIWDYIVENNLLVWDEQMFRLYGIQPDQFSGVYESWLAGLHPDDLPRCHEQIQRALRGEADFDVEFRIVWPDGTTHHLRGLANVQRDANGRPVRMIGTNWDITAHKLAEERLQASERSYRNQFANNSAAILLINPSDGAILDANAAAQKFYGYTHEQFLAMHVNDINNLPVAELKRIMASVQPGQGQRFEFLHRLADGSVREVGVSSSRIEFNGRQVLHAIIHDISKRKRAEAEVARHLIIQRELTLMAAEFVNVPPDRQDDAIGQYLAMMGGLTHADRVYLFQYDFDAGFMTNTHEWCADGVTPEIDHLQEVPIAELPDWADTHRRGEMVQVTSLAVLPVASTLRQALERQGIRSLITLPLMRQGICLGFIGIDSVREDRVWCDDDISLLRVLAEIFSIFRTRQATELENQQLQQSLIAARDEAQAAAYAKGLFLANMSHEIRTPLNAILGYAQIMGRGCIDCPHSKPLESITRSGEHLLALIDDLLNLVRSDAGVIALRQDDFDFHQTLEDVRIMFTNAKGVHDLSLEICYAPGVPQFIRADQGKIRQILVNLVSNAIKFTEIGGVKLLVSVPERDEASGVMIAVDVVDTGCGIGDDDLESIFNVFEQAEQGRNSGKGTGLGLPLSRRYARALGGDVTVTSRHGEGSHFLFTFRADLSNYSTVNPGKTGNMLRPTRDRSDSRILVVDDDPTNRDMLAMLLQMDGFQVEVVERAQDALCRLREGTRVDLVLMDKRMPDMDGYEAIRRIRELPGGNELAVLVVTASGFSDEKDLAREAGADGYVSKPIDREELLDEIARVTGFGHDAGQQAPADGPAPATGSAPAALTALPAEQRLLIDKVLRLGDISQMREITETIARTDARLAAGMRVLLDNYDYGRLRELLDMGNTSTANPPSAE